MAPSETATTRVFLDLEIGEPAAAAAQAAAHAAAGAFLAARRAQYGWPAALAELDADAEARELFLEAFAGDPAWAARLPDNETPRLAPPDALTRGRLEIALDSAGCPKTAENFRLLCTGGKGKGKASGKPLHYRGSLLHRIIPGFMAQGGDFVRGDGSGGEAAIGGGALKDEPAGLRAKHGAAGVVAMAHAGRPNSAASGFYVTLAPAPQLDGRHVVFGRVVNADGLALLGRLEALAASAGGAPRVPVVIADCGQL